jgi:hypothetical protein
MVNVVDLPRRLTLTDDILPAEYVARKFLESERLYQQRPFDEFTVERLKQVILRARDDGARSIAALAANANSSNAGKEP